MVPAKEPQDDFISDDSTANSSLFHSPQSTNPGQQDQEGEERPPASLSKNSQSVCTLWYEYEFCIAGRKPAKVFSNRDRGANRYTYSKMKIFWDLVVKMVHRRRSAHKAIDCIYVHVQQI